MRDRERRELKKFREEFAAEEKRKREARERPVRDLEAKLNVTHREIARLERARLSGEVPDSDKFIDDAVRPGITIPHSEVRDFTQRQVALFISANPNVYWCPELVQLLGRYFDKNGLQLTTASMIESVVNRMRDVGMLPEEPNTELVPKPTIVPERSMNLYPLVKRMKGSTCRQVNQRLLVVTKLTGCLQKISSVSLGCVPKTGLSCEDTGNTFSASPENILEGSPRMMRAVQWDSSRMQRPSLFRRA